MPGTGASDLWHRHRQQGLTERLAGIPFSNYP